MAVARTVTPPLPSQKQQWRDEFIDSAFSPAIRLTYDRVAKFDCCGDAARFEIRKVQMAALGAPFNSDQTDLQWYF